MIEQEFKERTKAIALMNEINEVLAMTVASIRTMRGANPKSKIENPK